VGQTPRLVVILIGTNNLTGTANAPSNTPAEIAEGIQAICRQVVGMSPTSRILLMGVFPRGPADDPLRARVRELNTMLQERTVGRHDVLFADIGRLFLSDDGNISVDIMNDGVHLTEDGYRIWADAIERVVRRELGQA
jgi:lysophospholipase L1-like esterase